MKKSISALTPWRKAPNCLLLKWTLPMERESYCNPSDQAFKRGSYFFGTKINKYTFSLYSWHSFLLFCVVAPAAGKYFRLCICNAVSHLLDIGAGFQQLEGANGNYATHPQKTVVTFLNKHIKTIAFNSEVKSNLFSIYACTRKHRLILTNGYV